MKYGLQYGANVTGKKFSTIGSLHAPIGSKLIVYIFILEVRDFKRYVYFPYHKRIDIYRERERYDSITKLYLWAFQEGFAMP